MARRIAALLAMLLAVMMTALPALAGEEAEETAAYTGVIGKRMNVQRWATGDSAVLGVIEAGTAVDVFNKGRTWTRIAYGDGQGYVLTKYVELVQRKNPFDGPMPGTSAHVAVACVLQDTSFLPEGYQYAVKVTAGSWLSIE